MAKTPAQLRASRAWRKRNPDKVAAQRKKWRAENPERSKEINRANNTKNRAAQNAWKKANRSRPSMLAIELRHNLKRKGYGVDEAWYRSTLEAQRACCAICAADKPGGRSRFFSVDHDHATGAVRALLCVNCNLALGLMRDQPELLRGAALYLERFKGPRLIAAGE